MTREDLEVLSRFEAVWERVQTGNGAPACTPIPWESVLGEIDRLREECRSMSRSAGGSMKYPLQNIAAQLDRAYRQGLTEWFLAEGDVLITSKSCNFASCTPYNLRKLWKDAVSLTERLQTASNGAETAFEAMGKEIEGAAEALKTLIACFFQGK